MDRKEHVKRGNAIYLAIIISYIVLNLGIEMIVGVFHVSFTYVELLLIVQVGYALPAIWYAVRKREPLSKSIRLRKLNIVTVLLLVMFAFSIMPMMNLLSALTLLFSKNYIQSTVSGMLGQTNFFICLFVIGILPAIMEEFVYRGVIYNEQRKGSVGKAILCSGLFFGLLHMNINQFSYAFVMGIVLAFVVEATDSILGAMVVHATINGFSTCLAKFQSYMLEKADKVSEAAASAQPSRQEVLDILPAYVKAAGIGAAIAAAIMLLIISYNQRREEIKRIFARRTDENGQVVKTSFIDIYFILAVAIAVALMISQEMA